VVESSSLYRPSPTSLRVKVMPWQDGPQTGAFLQASRFGSNSASASTWHDGFPERPTQVKPWPTIFSTL
jgi:hypothetical protein